MQKCSAGIKKTPGEVTYLGVGVFWVVLMWGFFKFLIVVETVLKLMNSEEKREGGAMGNFSLGIAGV